MGLLGEGKRWGRGGSKPLFLLGDSKAVSMYMAHLFMLRLQLRMSGMAMAESSDFILVRCELLGDQVPPIAEILSWNPY